MRISSWNLFTKKFKDNIGKKNEDFEQLNEEEERLKNALLFDDIFLGKGGVNSKCFAPEIHPVDFILQNSIHSLLDDKKSNNIFMKKLSAFLKKGWFDLREKQLNSLFKKEYLKPINYLDEVLTLLFNVLQYRIVYSFSILTDVVNDNISIVGTKEGKFLGEVPLVLKEYKPRFSDVEIELIQKTIIEISKNVSYEKAGNTEFYDKTELFVLKGKVAFGGLLNYAMKVVPYSIKDVAEITIDKKVKYEKEVLDNMRKLYLTKDKQKDIVYTDYKS